jgi:hypothetical protein
LTLGKVKGLIEAAKATRYGHRDATMILLAFRQGCGRPALDSMPRCLSRAAAVKDGPSSGHRFSGAQRA